MISRLGQHSYSIARWQALPLAYELTNKREPRGRFSPRLGDYAFAGGKTRLALNVENLFDRKYFPTADGNNNISPGAPRNARLTLSTAF